MGDNTRVSSQTQQYNVEERGNGLRAGGAFSNDLIF